MKASELIGYVQSEKCLYCGEFEAFFIKEKNWEICVNCAGPDLITFLKSRTLGPGTIIWKGSKDESE